MPLRISRTLTRAEQKYSKNKYPQFRNSPSSASPSTTLNRDTSSYIVAHIQREPIKFYWHRFHKFFLLDSLPKKHTQLARLVYFRKSELSSLFPPTKNEAKLSFLRAENKQKRNPFNFYSHNRYTASTSGCFDVCSSPKERNC